MRASYDTYEDVAYHCNEFSAPKRANRTTNSTTNTSMISCINCSHFDEDEYCKLDLYDDIVQNISE